MLKVIGFFSFSPLLLGLLSVSFVTDQKLIPVYRPTEPLFKSSFGIFVLSSSSKECMSLLPDFVLDTGRSKRSQFFHIRKVGKLSPALRA